MSSGLLRGPGACLQGRSSYQSASIDSARCGGDSGRQSCRIVPSCRWRQD
jgi:hypothetical protein